MAYSSNNGVVDGVFNHRMVITLFDAGRYHLVYLYVASLKLSEVLMIAG